MKKLTCLIVVLVILGWSMPIVIQAHDPNHPGNSYFSPHRPHRPLDTLRELKEEALAERLMQVRERELQFRIENQSMKKELAELKRLFGILQLHCGQD